MGNSSGGGTPTWAAYATAARESTGLSRPQLAAALGINRSTPWKWEAGKQVPESVPVVALFAATTGVDLDEALTVAGLRAEPRPPAELPTPTLHPLARQLDRLLGPDSPLDDDARNGLEIVAEAVLRPHRRRGA